MLRRSLRLTLALIAASVITHAQSVGINTTPAATAALDVSSTSKGMLVPRMSTVQRTAIGTPGTPATGLLVYDTDLNAFYFYNGSAWTAVSGSASSSSESVYGDGSAGALNITSSTDWTASPPANLNYQYSSITIASGATLTVPSGTKLRSTGAVAVNGAITVASGSPISAAPGISLTPALLNLNASTALPKAQSLTYINVPISAGGAGYRTNYATGGEGGGAIAIYSKGNISVSGTINARGNNSINNAAAQSQSGGGGGGGAGGLVVLLSKGTVAVSGTVNLNGGNGSNGYYTTQSATNYSGGGGGGGGILIAAASAAPSLTGTINLNGGTFGTNATGTGTTQANGGGGGASGGNGGTPGFISSSVPLTVATAGSVGYTVQIVTPSPENLVK